MASGSRIRRGGPPPTSVLLYSALLVTLGTTLAVRGGMPFQPLRLLQALALAWTTHLMTHYVNEYFDLEADRANPRPTGLTGGSRLLVRWGARGPRAW